MANHALNPIAPKYRQNAMTIQTSLPVRRGLTPPWSETGLMADLFRNPADQLASSSSMRNFPYADGTARAPEPAGNIGILFSLWLS
jgi:hypothetical protein